MPQDEPSGCSSRILVGDQCHALLGAQTIGALLGPQTLSCCQFDSAAESGLVRSPGRLGDLFESAVHFVCRFPRPGMPEFMLEFNLVDRFLFPKKRWPRGLGYYALELWLRNTNVPN